MFSFLANSGEFIWRSQQDCKILSDEKNCK